MKSFKDRNGHEWSLSLDVNALKRCRSMIEVDPLAIFENDFDLYNRMQEDAVLLVNMLWCFVKPQAEKDGITDEQFGAALTQEAIDLARDELPREIVGFFPAARRGPALKLLEKNAEMNRKAAELAVMEIENLQPPESSGGTSGGLPESSG